MKIIVQFSGGKDSLAALIHSVRRYGKSVVAVFSDTAWEHPSTYDHINQVVEKLGIQLVVLNPSLTFVELAKKKKRFPSTKARFCTDKLKIEPFIDWVLDEVKDNFLVIQGIRADESPARAKMDSQCHYFKFYTTPYGYDQNNRAKFYTYRKKEVLEYCNQYAADVDRPIFEWTAEQVFDYIASEGFSPNPLYLQGFKRVGCFPCIMCTHQELKNIIEDHPETMKKLRDAENEVGRTFFPPNYIPKHASKNGTIVTLDDAVKYIAGKNQTGNLFEKPACTSFYSLCE